MSTQLQDGVILSTRSLPVRRGVHPVLAQITKLLQTSSYAELRKVECAFHAGLLTLTGTVSSFYMKQMATSLAGSVEGIDQIDNRLDVADARNSLSPYPA